MTALRRRHLLVLVLAVLLAAWPALPARAASGPVVPPEQYLVGGCRIAFDAKGVPSPAGSADKPCVGVRSVTTNGQGDLDVHLTPEESQAAIRLTATPSTQLSNRGIQPGLSGGRSTITVRLYDDAKERRVDLRTSVGRSRVAGGAVHVGWTKAVGPGAPGTDPGHDALGRYRDLAATSNGTVPGGCVLRLSSAGAQVHANTSHRCVGVESVSITSSGMIQLRASAEQRGAVVNVEGDADETLTDRGITLGVSASASTMSFALYDSRLGRRLDLTRASDLERVSHAWANVWLGWTKTLDRPGSPNATTIQAPDKYGPYRDGSAPLGSISQRGCTLELSGGTPRLVDNSVRRCTGVTKMTRNARGEVVLHGTVSPVVSTSTVPSKSLTDSGIRVGITGGGHTSTYRFYSTKLDRPLDLTKWADRAILGRSGSSVLVGWVHPVVP